MTATNFKAVGEFTKYTLAMNAAGLIYTFEKLAPPETADQRTYAAVLLVAFLFALICGIVVFSALTSAQHDEETRGESSSKLVKYFGILHAALLVLAYIGLFVELARRFVVPIVVPVTT